MPISRRGGGGGLAWADVAQKEAEGESNKWKKEKDRFLHFPFFSRIVYLAQKEKNGKWRKRSFSFFHLLLSPSASFWPRPRSFRPGSASPLPPSRNGQRARHSVEKGEAAQKRREEEMMSAGCFSSWISSMENSQLQGYMSHTVVLKKDNCCSLGCVVYGVHVLLSCVLYA